MNRLEQGRPKRGESLDIDSALALTIADRGWAHARHFLDEPLWRTLAAELRAAQADGQLRQAGIGAGARYRVAEDIRGDRIRWIDPARPSAAEQEALSRLDELRLACNRELQLGLFDFEGHFASYPAGGYYRRHRDRPRESDARVLSCVLYLNELWQTADDGRLRLYLDDHAEPAHVDFLPEGGALVCFLSSRFFHEVLPARRERLSLTGWFRQRST